ncbi:SMP-30/gluconolactonase/LRE family protein [Ravibacter arvi]
MRLTKLRTRKGVEASAIFVGATLLMMNSISCSTGSEKKAMSEEALFVATVLTDTNSFTSGAEGPAVDDKGNLYAVNFATSGTIGMVQDSGKAGIFVTLPEGSVGNGIRFNSKKEMLIADYPKHNILKVDMGTKEISVFAHEPKMNQPNDIAIDGKDRLYASDPNWSDSTGNIWRIDPDGKVTLLEAGMGTTNGIEVSPGNDLLYVNESVQRKVWVYDLSPEGNVSNKRLLIEFPDFGMDGMRCDQKGNLYITRHGKGTIAIVAPDGKLIKEVTTTGKMPSNLAFGGPDGKTIYITIQDRGNIEKFRTDTPGREWKQFP